MLVEIAPEIYTDFVTYQNDKKILYISMLKPLYGMLKASLLYYKKFVLNIKKIGYILNLYDLCIANKMINRKQYTLIWYIDNVKSSYMDLKVNKNLLSCVKKNMGVMS